MKQAWQIADIIDLEFFLSSDAQLVAESGKEPVAARDRDIYLQHIQPELQDNREPSLLLQGWLNCRRTGTEAEDGASAPLPGSLWRELFTLSSWGSLVAGSCLGCALAAGFLSYTGSAPLNVSMFLALFVVVQLLLLTIQGFFLFFRQLRGKRLTSTLLYNLISRLMFKGMTGAAARLHRRMTGAQRLRLGVFLGELHRKKNQYPGLSIWPPFRLFQLSGIGFNLGVIFTLLFKVSVADIAFGWQSTLQLSEPLVADLVRWIALPWSWCIPGQYAYPSLEQIAGSKMVLKDGIYHLATRDLVSWWPFLCLAMFVYGLLPRALLFLYSLWKEQRALDQLNFDTPVLRQLLQRMLTPLVTTRGQTAVDERSEVVAAHRVTKEPAAPPPATEDGTTLVLLPDELYQACTTAELEDLLASRCGPTLEMLRFGGLDQTDDELFATVAAVAPPGIAGVVVIQEAWQPPIQEVLSLLRALRGQIGRQVSLGVALLGKPDPMTVFTPAGQQDLSVWTDKINSIGDPYLEVYPLVQA